MAKNIDHEIKDFEFAAKNPRKWAELPPPKSEFAVAGQAFSKRWARLMQARMADGTSLHLVAEQAYQDADYEGLSGGMSHEAERFLIQHWLYGDVLKDWVIISDLVGYGASPETVIKVYDDPLLFRSVKGLAESRRWIQESLEQSKG